MTISSLRRSLINTFGSIGLTKAAQLVFPLITIPYLARTIRVEGMGVIAFTQAIMTYLSMIPDLGMNIYAPRQIAINQNNKQETQRLLTNISILKSLATLLSFVLLLSLIAFVPLIHKNWILFLLAAPGIISGIFSPQWFFLGMQKMWGYSFSSLIGFLCNTLCIFLFVHKTADYFVVILIGSVTCFIPALYSYWFLSRAGLKYIDVSSIDFPYIKTLLLGAAPLFGSMLFSAFYGNIFIVVLGFAATPKIVGYYSSAERVVKAGLMLFGTFGQSLYPFLSKAYAAMENNAFKIFRKTAPITLSIAIAMGIAFFCGAGIIVKLLYGPAFSPTVPVLRALSALFILLGINDACGMQFFIPLGKNKKQLQATFVGFIVSLCVTVPLCSHFATLGAATSYIITELSISFFLLFSMLSFYRNSGNLLRGALEQ